MTKKEFENYCYEVKDRTFSIAEMADDIWRNVIIPMEVAKNLHKPIVSGSLPDFEYEMFFKSEPNDFCKIDGWYPIATDRIKNPDRIEKYIENGLLRKIRP